MSTGRGRATASGVEHVVQVLILVAVGLMAGAASFRHVHDWTMQNSRPGTGDWFGWANAMVTELVPIAAGLDALRRYRLTHKVPVYSCALVVGALGLSVTGQLSQAVPTTFGYMVAVLPAVAFAALSKLVIFRPHATDPAPAVDPVPMVADAGPDVVDPAAVVVPDSVALADFDPAPAGPAERRHNGYAIGSGIVR